MKSLAELAALALALAAHDAPPGGEGPRATSGEGRRHDQVGRATEGAQVTHATLPPGSVVEVTSLADGTTLLMRIDAVADAADSGIIALPRSLLDRIAGGGNSPVRVRAVSPAPQEEAALRAGEPVERLSAPVALLTGLRKQAAMPVAPVAPIADVTSISPPKPSSVAVSPPRAPVAKAGGWSVQVAVLSEEARARALARELNGTSQAAGNLWRVRMGPFTDRAAADSARAKAMARGFRDARIVRSN